MKKQEREHKLDRRQKQKVQMKPRSGTKLSKNNWWKKHHQQISCKTKNDNENKRERVLTRERVQTRVEGRATRKS